VFLKHKARRLLDAHAALAAEEDCVSETQGASGSRGPPD
jgi:hypothetical protein